MKTHLNISKLLPRQLDYVFKRDINSIVNSLKSNLNKKPKNSVTTVKYTRDPFGNSQTISKTYFNPNDVTLFAGSP